MTLLAAIKHGAGAGFLFCSLFAAAAHFKVTELEDVAARGQTVVATVEGGTVGKGRRNSGTRLNLSWTEARSSLTPSVGALLGNPNWSNGPGTPREFRGLPVSHEFAQKIITDNTLTIETVTIKAVPGEPNTKPIILDDVGISIESNQQSRIFFGIGGLLCGLVWLALALGVRRRDPVAA